MEEITHRFVEANGIRMHIAESGKGPLVILCHGFPEALPSWLTEKDVDYFASEFKRTGFRGD